ncbi:TPA: hypothetical protein O7139_005494 [Salmonella enterica]|nr:hypothetical protein [Salmonella enterica subsp. enterica serovar Typhimurium]HDC2549001.1 hypothetical protein [Salmonella enterica]HDC2563347.1 hypothetical protein [Salmonella enterica]
MCDVDFSAIITSFYHYEPVLSVVIAGCIIAIPLAVFIVVAGNLLRNS